MSDIRARHQAWLTSVEKRLSQQADVFGLVAFGSTANVARVDEWSDHDLAIMVRVGSEDHYRDGSAWLPRLDAVVKSTVESQFARGVGLFLLGIMHGVGRERRGESVSAGYIVRAEATMHLLRAIKAASSPVSTRLGWPALS